MHAHTCVHAYNTGLPGGSEVKNLSVKQEAQIQSLGGEDLLEKEVATHSRIPAWEIPWTEETGGLKSWAPRVGHNLATKQQHTASIQHTYMCMNTHTHICISVLCGIPGEKNGNSFQYSCLENPMDRGALQASPWGQEEVDTTERLSHHYVEYT